MNKRYILFSRGDEPRDCSGGHNEAEVEADLSWSIITTKKFERPAFLLLGLAGVEADDRVARQIIALNEKHAPLVGDRSQASN
jgi:hypothetical protein